MFKVFTLLFFSMIFSCKIQAVNITWIGIGSGGTGTNFNLASNWSGGTLPGPTDNVIINYDFSLASGSKTIILTAPITINNLTITGVNGAAAGQKLSIDAGGNLFNINGNLLITSSGDGIDVVELQSSGSVIIIGAATFGSAASKNQYAGIGGNGLAIPVFTFYGDVTFNDLSFTDSLDKRPSANFYTPGKQRLTFNNINGPSANFYDMVIGNGTSPYTKFTVSGNGTKIPYTNRGVENSLTLNAGDTLDLSVNVSFNQQIFPSNQMLTLTKNSVLKLGGTSGGTTGSNFPKGFTQYGDGAGSTTSFDPTSTVDYYGNTAQTIFKGPIYGNITLSNTGMTTPLKTAGGPLTVQGNLLINPKNNFRANTGIGWAHNIGGNFTNNGAFSYAGGTTNTINFYGNTNAIISGTSATGFHTMTMNKGISIATTLDVNSVITVTNALNFSNGLLRVPASGSITVNTSNPNISKTSGLYVNGGTFNTIATSLLSDGLFQLIAGNVSIGTISGNSLNMNSPDPSAAGTFVMSGGTLNVAGRLTFSTGGVTTSSISGGIINLSTVGNTTTTGTLDMTGATKINVSGGLVTFNSANTGSAGDVNILFTTGAKNFTGGLLQIGTATTSGTQVFKINSQVPLYDITVFNTNSPTAQLTNDLIGSHNITIQSGSTLDAATNDKNISLSGNWVNDGTFNSGAYPAQNTTVTFNGGPLQTVSGSAVKTPFNNLKLSNSNGLAFLQNVDLLNTFSFGTTGATLTTNDLLTVKSSATNTGQIANVTGNTIAGEVTVERFIASNVTHLKSWQLLAIPHNGNQTINNSWQEGCGPNSDCVPFHGTQITGTGTGFDLSTTTPSMKTWVSGSSTYIGISGTGTTIKNPNGYFLFVRGDRSVQLFGQPATSTTLRTKGPLFTPTNAPVPVGVAAMKNESVGNPYASAIDMHKIALNNVDQLFILWDPALQAGSAYGLGAFQYFSQLQLGGTSDNNYYAVPGGGSYGPFGTPNSYIQSGQAFFVQSSSVSNGTVSFDESAKASGSFLVTSPARNPQLPQQLRTNLYGVNPDGSGFMTDGTLNQFSSNYSNGIDGKDARKNTNTSENLSIKASGSLLSIERRQMVSQQDTIFLNLTGVRAQLYRYEFIAQNMDVEGLQGFVEDTYLHTRTSMDLNGTTLVDFTIVDIPGSYASDRFRIVFTATLAGPLPVTFTLLKATRQNNNINVEWTVENERNIKSYEVEKSIDGIHFKTMDMQAATANGGNAARYLLIDAQPVNGYNYYRIRSNDQDGKTQLTKVVKVLVETITQDISIYPNPITDGRIHLQFMNQPEGKYGIRLMDKIGQLILAKKITRKDGSNTELVKWDVNLAHGIYLLEITKPDGGIKNINVLY